MNSTSLSSTNQKENQHLVHYNAHPSTYQHVYGVITTLKLLPLCIQAHLRG